MKHLTRLVAFLVVLFVISAIAANFAPDILRSWNGYQARAAKAKADQDILDAKNSETSAKQAASVAKAEAARRREEQDQFIANPFDAADLTNAYHQNEIASDLQYKGKRLSVAGQITGFHNINSFDGKSIPSITIASQRSIMAISCDFAESDAPRLAALAKGDSVTVLGVCKGLRWFVNLDECRILVVNDKRE